MHSAQRNVTDLRLTDFERNMNKFIERVYEGERERDRGDEGVRKGERPV